MAQLINITSEALQATIRRLLPSQQGFGEDLQATNVVTPIIDLTPSAEGSVLPSELQQAMAFDSQTAYAVQNGSQTIINSPGFYRVFGSCNLDYNNTTTLIGKFVMSDGVSTKNLIQYVAIAPADAAQIIPHDFIVFAQAGETLTVDSNGSRCIMHGSTRQIATVNGDLINPAGFVFQ